MKKAWVNAYECHVCRWLIGESEMNSYNSEKREAVEKKCPGCGCLPRWELIPLYQTDKEDTADEG